MAAKRIQISDDAGVNYFTLPGSSGDLRIELADVNDTIFGQTFESHEVSIGQWQVTANAYFKGVSGYIATLKKQGTPTTMTGETTTLVSGKTYQITSAAKRVLDYATAITVSDAATDKTSEVESIDYLSGTVTFKSTYTPTGPITITGKYTPLVAIAKGKSFSLTQNAAEIDTTDYETAAGNGGWRTFKPGLRTAGLEVGGIYDVTNGAKDALVAKLPFIIEISPDNTAGTADETVFRGFYKYINTAQAGDVGALETETINFGLWVPDGELVDRPFGWYFGATSKLNTACKKIVQAWQDESLIKAKYLPDGGTTVNAGTSGDVVVTECSLNNTLEGLNEFRFTFRGSGTPAAV